MRILLQYLFMHHHAKAVRRCFRSGELECCLQHIDYLMKSPQQIISGSKLRGYRALCQFRQGQRQQICMDVERTLFLLRANIQKDRESYALWHELKGCLSALRGETSRAFTLLKAQNG